VERKLEEADQRTKNHPGHARRSPELFWRELSGVQWDDVMTGTNLPFTLPTHEQPRATFDIKGLSLDLLCLLII